MSVDLEILRQDIASTKQVFEAHSWPVSILLPEEVDLQKSEPGGLFLCGDERYSKIAHQLKPGAKYFGGVHGVVASRGGGSEEDYHRAAEDIREILGLRPTTHSVKDFDPEHPLAGCGFFKALRDGHYGDILGEISLNIQQARNWVEEHLPGYEGFHHLLEGPHEAYRMTINFVEGFTLNPHMSRLTSDFWLLRPLDIDPLKAASITERTAGLILPQQNRLAEIVVPHDVY